MEYNIRTIYGGVVQTSSYRDVATTFPSYTTMNEKLSIQSGVVPLTTDRPSLKYYGIGNKGHTMVVGANGLTKPEVLPHKPTDASLYGQIPFVLRELSNDLVAADRAKYAMRREEVHGGVTYAAYYLRRLDTTSISVVMRYHSIVDGVETITTFVPSSDNLNPTVPTVTGGEVVVTTGDKVSVLSVATLTISSDEAQELRDVSKILYDDEEYAIISEIALCTGVDKTITVSGSSGSFNFNEAIGVQIAQFVATNLSMVFNNTGATINLNVGVSEPMWFQTT